jgi:hypothetical protein
MQRRAGRVPGEKKSVARARPRLGGAEGVAGEMRFQGWRVQ